ncbi:hypothetical protein LRR81_08280 [Metabacillus sp. GX 13764]|uniref:hypothetical protein n=1 Tax=Metabacillus kandeliae TaxID=2900151 RepID=UPI001E3CC0C4|nr:hypothetical protein [Metabacillus kandeliae]MCD7034229.1 hypothetical protein [Metabacillus kandeliae]
MRSSLVKRPLKDLLNKQEEDAARKHDWESESSRFGIQLVLMILEHPSTKPVVRQLIKELKQCKGTVLADIKAQDGTSVLIKL